MTLNELFSECIKFRQKGYNVDSCLGFLIVLITILAILIPVALIWPQHGALRWIGLVVTAAFISAVITMGIITLIEYYYRRYIAYMMVKEYHARGQEYALNIIQDVAKEMRLAREGEIKELNSALEGCRSHLRALGVLAQDVAQAKRDVRSQDVSGRIFTSLHSEPSATSFKVTENL